MLKLRFINLYNVNKSPLQLSYQNNDMDVMGNDAALVMRFTKPHAINTSPLTMRFGDDTGPVDPTLPILQANIGIESELSWLIPPLITQAQVLEYQTESVKNELKTTFNSAELVPVVFSIKRKIAVLVTEQKSVEWGNSGNISNTIQIPYKIITSIEHDENDFNWLTELYVEHTEFKLLWNSSESIKTENVLHWPVKPLLELRKLVLHYGQTDKEYICYWRNHQFKGYLKLDFNAPYQARTGSIKMRFNAPDKVCYWGLPGGLVRSDDDIPTIDRKIPIEPQIRNTYIMQPTINCVRVSDDVKILISSVNYSVSRSQFSATGSLKFCSRIDFERALGQELKISINGYDFYVICEQPSTANRFANSSYSASCRGRFALLSAPYARATNYANPTAKTLAGIMSDILVNTGWSLDNKMIDYPIPTGAFTYTDLTPAAALLSVAKSAGAMLDIDSANKTVSVIPAWPVMPWDTENAICDVILNDSIILEHNTSQTINQTHNAVFVRGEQQGVACKIKRAGTLGDQFSSDVVDSLITDNQAARQRGSYELANSGNKQQSTIRTKLLNDLPPIRPGMLVGVTYASSTYKATCDNMDISASISESGAITVSQTIKVISNV
ncbi:hypothetical protein [Pseudoalteromonas sp. SR45-5]|uniref:hypothetical protein n=1 Tax=Pseudoalteromonas sp. SR45-5 TaxID=2760928 RepID=UPI0015F8A60A|nr:hypothetical protein [Pseudoalteromonas sp. SR45-5]MBB1354643.1 hypothetical protein [Pseudoalteromonas sp. SR45-5]